MDADGNGSIDKQEFLDFWKVQVKEHGITADSIIQRMDNLMQRVQQNKINGQKALAEAERKKQEMQQRIEVARQSNQQEAALRLQRQQEREALLEEEQNKAAQKLR